MYIYRRRDDDSRVRRAAVVILDTSGFFHDFLSIESIVLTRDDNTQRRPSARYYVCARLNIK